LGEIKYGLYRFKIIISMEIPHAILVCVFANQWAHVNLDLFPSASPVVVIILNVVP